MPDPAPGLGARLIFRAQGVQRGGRHVVEGEQHRRDVAEGAALATPRGEAAVACAADVQDDEVLPREEDTTEVEVAVMADLLGVDASYEERLEPREDGILRGDDLGGHATRRLGQFALGAPEQGEDATHLVARGLVLRALVHRRVRLRLEGRVGRGRERHVELGGTAPEARRELAIGVEELRVLGARPRGGEHEQRFRGNDRRSVPWGLSERPLVGATDLAPRMLPRGALVDDELLDDRERDRLAPRHPVLDVAEDPRRDARQALRVEVATDLELGGGAFFHPVIELHDVRAAKGDRHPEAIAGDEPRLAVGDALERSADHRARRDVPGERTVGRAPRRGFHEDTPRGLARGLDQKLLRRSRTAALELSDDGALERARGKRRARREHEEREDEGVRLALCVVYTHLDENERGRCAVALTRHPDRLGDHHAGDRAGRPLACVEVGREHLLQASALGAEEERVGAGADDRRRPEIAQALLLARVPRGLDAEPVEVMPTEREQIRPVAHHRELGAAHQLDGHHSLHAGEIELDVLHVPRQVRDHEDDLVLEAAHERQDARVRRVQELDRAASEGPEALPQGNEALGPPEERVRVRLLRFDVERLVVILGVDDDRQDHPLRIGPREARVAVGAPLHRRADAVAVAEVDVVAHPDLVAVIEHRRARHREEEPIQELHLPAIIADQRGEPAADAEVDSRLRLVCVRAIHVVALVVGHHLERELVVVAEEHRPLARRVELRGLPQDVDDGEAILHVNRHEEARHDREVEVHVALVAVAEIARGVFGPLVCLGKEHAPRELRIDVLAERLQVRVGLGEVLAVRSLGLVEVGDGVEPESVDAAGHPEIDDAQHRLVDGRVLEVEIRLVREEAMPEVGLRDRVP